MKTLSWHGLSRGLQPTSEARSDLAGCDARDLRRSHVGGRSKICSIGFRVRV